MQTIQVNRCVNCMEDLKGTDVFVCPHCGKATQTVEQPLCCLKPFSILHGKYLVGRMLGQGGFGITYVGLDLVLDTKVAIKECYPMSLATRDCSVTNHLQWNMRMVQNNLWRDGCDNFLKEARKMAKMKDIPEVVRVQDTFEENNTAYIIMDFVEGITLKQWLEQNGVLSYHECVKMLRPLISALVNLHQQGFIHRDISPDNIMVQPDGHLRLLDLGAAKELTPQDQNMSQLVTKHGFSPIEQYTETGKIGPWTDVYAICATIYYCITGQTIPSALDRIDHADLEIPSSVKEPLSASMEATLKAGLEFEAPKRIQNAEELLRRLDGEEPESSKPKKKWWIAICAGAAALLIVVFALFFKNSVEVKPDPSPDPAPEILSVEQLGTSNANLLNEGKYAEIAQKFEYFIAADGALYVGSYDEEDMTFYVNDSQRVCDHGTSITLSDSQVYFITTDYAAYSICSMNQNGSNVATLYSVSDMRSLEYLQYVRFSDQREYLYFMLENEADSEAYSLCRYKLDTDEVETVVSGDLWWYNLYGDSIYYTELTGDNSISNLVRTDLDGNDPTVLNSNKALSAGFIEDDAMYLWSYKDEALLVYNLDGSVSNSFIGFYDTSMDVNYAISYGDGWLYYINPEDESIHRIRSNGTGDSVLIRDHKANLICFFESWLWFAESVPTEKEHQYLVQTCFAYKDGEKMIDILEPDLSWKLNTENIQNFEYMDSEDGEGVIITGYTGKLTEFEIPDTFWGKPVVGIADSAFEESDVAEVGLPESVRTIGDFAFYKCSNLTFIGLPDGLETVGYAAFGECSSLTAVDLPNGLISIGNLAFAETRLSGIYIPESVKDIGPGAFLVCADADFTEFNVSADNKKYRARDGVLYDQTMTFLTDLDVWGYILVAFPVGRSGSYTIRNDTIGIEGFAFARSKLTDLTIPENVYIIGDDAFWNSSISDITINKACVLRGELGSDITVHYYDE